MSFEKNGEAEMPNIFNEAWIMILNSLKSRFIFANVELIIVLSDSFEYAVIKDLHEQWSWTSCARTC